MVLSKITPIITSGSRFSFIARSYIKCSVSYDIKLFDKVTKNQIKRISRCFHANELLPLDDTKLRQNEFNFSQTVSNTIINKGHAHESHYDIPDIINYSVLLEALRSHDVNVSNPINLLKKICNALDAFENQHPNSNGKDDLIKLSLTFDKLLTETDKVTLVEMNDKTKSIRNIRNSFSHDNYYSLSNKDGMNESCFGSLRTVPFLDPEQKLGKLEKDEWVIWNIDHRNKVIPIRFCYIIKEKNLWLLIAKFIYECYKIIKKSKQNQTKYINDFKEAQLIEVMLKADKSSK